MLFLLRMTYPGRLKRALLEPANSESVARFNVEDDICRHGCPQRIVGRASSTRVVGRPSFCTRYTAFELVCGRDCILPIESSVASWSVVDWDGVRTREGLLPARMQQLDERSLELAQVAKNLHESRKANKGYFDDHKHLRSLAGQIKVGSFVLYSTTWEAW